MERLTYRLNDQCDNPTDSIILKPYLRYEDPETRKKILNRLAAYEETGLEPEEIADFMKRWEQAVEIGGMLKKHGIDHIRDIIQAEQDGRLVVLPCKVGDTVYQIDAEMVYESEVKWIIFDCDDIAFDERAIGGSIFLTREEAEAALAQKGGTHEDSGGL